VAGKEGLTGLDRMNIKNLINLRRWVSRLPSVVTNIYLSLKQLNGAYIRIEEINVAANEVILHSPGIRTILKLSIPDAIADFSILCRLMPMQACWLGYYSSLTLAQGNRILEKPCGPLLRFKRGPFKILSLDRRGMISYLDTRSNTVHLESPMMIAQNQAIINSFDSSQACYIGILAGINKFENKHTETSLPQKAMLRLIK
jgi:hypothetical protein